MGNRPGKKGYIAGSDRTDRRSWVRFPHHTLAFFGLQMTSEARYVFIFEIYGSNYICYITWNIVNISDKTEKGWHPWWELNPRPSVRPIRGRKRANWAADFSSASWLGSSLKIIHIDLIWFMVVVDIWRIWLTSRECSEWAVFKNSNFAHSSTLSFEYSNIFEYGCSRMHRASKWPI